MTNREEIERRRTFAIISHPDAGKTTLTEKLLLYGGAINQAGSVKGKQSARHAVSDWMDIEKQRGISVTSSVLQFDYAGKCVNILDTPGHQDFSEDTYRTLMAADSAVMVIDAAKGVEAQTIKLFKVCTLRHIPIFTFINKMDREARDPFELMENIEEILGIKTFPMNWPIGCGKDFKGVFDRMRRKVLAFESDGRANGVKKVDEIIDPIVERICKGVASAYRATVDCKFNKILGPTINDPAMTEVCQEATRKALGDDALVDFGAVTGGEDFSFYADKVPAAFAFVGVGNEACGAVWPQHSDKFRVDEDAIINSVALYVSVAMEHNAQ